jgi:hypothetical protein
MHRLYDLRDKLYGTNLVEITIGAYTLAEWNMKV